MAQRTARIYQGDIGARLVLFVTEGDGTPHPGISTATLKQIKLKTPSGQTKVFSAGFASSPFGAGDGSDGGIEYTTTDTADLPEGGVYEIRAYIEFDASNKRHSQPATIYVGAV